MYLSVDFGEPGLSHMRNGASATHGVVLQGYGREVLVSPINSRGVKTTGFVGVETASLPEVIQGLARLYLEAHPERDDALKAIFEAAFTMDGRGADPVEADPEAEADASPGMGM